MTIDHIHNIEITEHTLMDLTFSKSNILFGHVAKLGGNTPAHQALRHQINICLGQLAHNTWQYLRSPD